MRALVFSATAKADISDVWHYTVNTWGIAQADTYNRLIEAACQNLADGSRYGLSAEHVRVGYRKLLVGKHTIYFRQSDDMIEVVRILHQSMDVDEQLG